MNLWSCLLWDANDSLNRLWPSFLNPTFSAYNILHGVFDFNQTPLAPPGCKVLPHENLNQRKNWATHGINGWYIVCAREGYWCYWVYVKSTPGECLLNRVNFSPQHTKIPFMSFTKSATKAATNLNKVLKTNSPATLLPHIGSHNLQALKDLTTIFNKTAKIPTSSLRVIPTMVPRPICDPTPESNPPSPSLRVKKPNLITPPLSPRPHNARAPRMPTPITPEKERPNRYPTRTTTYKAFDIKLLIEATTHSTTSLAFSINEPLQLR